MKHFRDRFRGEILTDSEVRSVRRGENGVSLSIGSEEHTFDILILATHADTTFKLLADPSDDERRLLSPWRYQENHTVLHSDTSALPKNRRAWASWNYVRESAGNGKKVSVSYHMNRLQGLKSKKEYCVTLNRSRPIAKDQIVAEFLYHHPCYTLESMATQDELHKLQGKKNTFFCGSYFGFGFHEDGIQSGESVAELLGCPCT